MLLLNYAHPLTDAQLARIAELLGAVPAQIGQALPLGPQVAALADAAQLTAAQWQPPLIVNPPGFDIHA